MNTSRDEIMLYGVRFWSQNIYFRVRYNSEYKKSTNIFLIIGDHKTLINRKNLNVQPPKLYRNLMRESYPKYKSGLGIHEKTEKIWHSASLSWIEFGWFHVMSKYEKKWITEKPPGIKLLSD